MRGARAASLYAASIRSAGHAPSGVETSAKLTLLPDHSLGADHEHGAMLQIENSVSVPDEFQLYEPSGLLLHEVRVVRRASRFIGVAITATRNIAESVDPRVKRLRMIQW